MGPFLILFLAYLRHPLPAALLRGALRAGSLLALLAASACAFAQTSPASAAAPPAAALSTTAALHGVVTSTDGAVYEGARVALELNGPPQLITATDSTGAFSFANLAPGAYKLTVSAPGFITQTISTVLDAGVDFDASTIALRMTGATNSVTVSAGSQVEIAQEQLNIEEKQRVLGVFPNYYVSYDPDPEPLTPRQKFELAWKISIDPITWAMTATIAGGEQAANIFPGYGQGMQGYGKRFGANYADNVSGTMIGGAILPSLFRQDPRYIYKGTGSAASRVWYAISNSVVCRGDNRRTQPNYSSILGGLAAGGISNLYYPASDRSGLQVTFSNALIGLGEGALQNLAQEFIVKKLTPRLPKFSSSGIQ
ncbi:MAG: carboxypeptidase-like regulatory domain-containing protein [Terracidiphilus sp.]